MKTPKVRPLIRRSTIALSCLFLLSITQIFAQKGTSSYNDLWKELEKYKVEGLTQSAIDLSEKILQKAKKEENGPQRIKAQIHVMYFKGIKEEDSFITSIQELESEIIDAEHNVHALLHSALAEMYWWYYLNNRWKIIQRTTSEKIQEGDMTTWTAKEFVSKVDYHYQQSLSNDDFIKNTDADDFNLIWIGGKDGRDIRPTLYDVIAHRAIDFYSHSYSGLTEARDQFAIVDADYFLPSSEFLKLEIEEGDYLSFDLKALQLYQSLLAFHYAHNNEDAAVYNDLERLRFVSSRYASADKDSLYEKSLLTLADASSERPISAEVNFTLAQHYLNKGGNYNAKSGREYRWFIKKAAILGEAVVKQYPESRGGKQCSDMLQSIKGIAVQISTENVASVNEHVPYSIRYKNATKIYFRLVSNSENIFYQNGRNNNANDIQYFLKKKAILEWSIDLPDSGDYQFHRVELRMPGIKAGYYALISSTNASFSTSKNVLSSNVFYSSGLAYFYTQGSKAEGSVFVTNRITGRPLKGVRAKFYEEKYNYQERRVDLIELSENISGENGSIELPGGDRNINLRVLLIKGRDSLMLSQPVFVRNQKQAEPRPLLQSALFTDRMVYRPGQVIYFKGILMEKKGFETEIQKGKVVTIKLQDRNNQEVGRQDLTTNDFGTFHGSFTLPSSVLTGTFFINDGVQRYHVSVEEYKRPNFYVEIDKPEKNIRLGEMVTIKGKAISYNGVPLSGAKGNFHVERNANWAIPYHSYYPYPSGNKTEIGHGSFLLDNEGNFEISFESTPDKTISKETKPVFNFSIDIMISDVNGESQGSKISIPLAYHSLLIGLGMKDEMEVSKLDSIQITSTNLSGNFTPAKIDVELYKLIPPETPFKKRLWEESDYKVKGNQEIMPEIDGNQNILDMLKVGKKVLAKQVNTDITKTLSLSELKGQSGAYMVKLKSVDPYGQEVEWSDRFMIYDKKASSLAIPMVFWSKLLTSKAKVGESAKILVGSSIKTGMAYYTINNKSGHKASAWYSMTGKQQLFDVIITEEDRGSISVQFLLIHEGRVYLEKHDIVVPLDHKALSVKLETFRNDLKPGDYETWKVSVRDNEGKVVSGEVLASMYDMSLDVIRPNSWNFNPYNWRAKHLYWLMGDNFQASLSRNYPFIDRKYYGIQPRSFDQLNWFGFNYGGGYFDMPMTKLNTAMDGAEAEEFDDSGALSNRSEKAPAQEGSEGNIEEQGSENESQGEVRTNFKETAFFYPELKTDEEGNAEFSFEVPDALTKWKLQLLALTKSLQYGQAEEVLITKKEVMVVPNYPRFLITGDTIIFSSRVSNLLEEKVDLNVSIKVSNALNGMSMPDLLLASGNKTVSLGAGQSKAVKWKLIAPLNPGMIEVAVYAKGGKHSDGEMRRIPVLSNSILVTESYPISIDGGEKQEVLLAALEDAEKNEGIKPHRLTVEFTANPIWYVVQALPYLADINNESTGQLFNRFYANSIGFHISKSNENIQKVFDIWSTLSPESFASKLEKNPELKSTVLSETPWLLDAKNEEEDKKRIANFFNENNMTHNLNSSLFELMQVQTMNGGWPWFKGMKDNRFVTQQIVLGLGRLSHLGVKSIRNNQQLFGQIQLAVEYMDARIKEDYDYIMSRSSKPENDHLGANHVQYLFARSYFKDLPINDKYKEAHNYFEKQAEKYWLSKNKYLQGMMALSFHRKGNKEMADKILLSLKENAIDHKEFGIYWKKENGYFWYQADIEKQAMLIEAFEEISNDEAMVNGMKKWLLKQKQTKIWPTGKATTEACYAMLLRGDDLLAESNKINLTVGNETFIIPSESASSEAGTGYTKMDWIGKGIEKEMKVITAENTGKSVAWGAAYFQYFQSADDVKAAKTALSVSRELLVKEYNEEGAILREMDKDTKLETGEVLVVKMTIKTDRDLEFVHLKDMKAAALEPMEQTSGYRYSGGLGYYLSIRDAATHFYFDRLPKGTYVLEYELKASNSGDFSSGISTIQSFYAPEFSAHSDGGRIRID